MRPGSRGPWPFTAWSLLRPREGIQPFYTHDFILCVKRVPQNLDPPCHGLNCSSKNPCIEAQLSKCLDLKVGPLKR